MKQYSRTSNENGWGRTQEKKKKQKAQIMKVLAQLGRILLLSASCSHTQSNLQLRYKPIHKRHKKFPALMTVYYH